MSNQTAREAVAPGSTEVKGARWPGYAACIWGLIFAGISFYWGSGGTALLSTIGGSIESMARAGDPSIYAAVWITGALKVVGSVLALALVQQWGLRLPRRPVQFLAWAAAILVTLYGGFLVAADALGETGAIKVTGPVDWEALRWHLWVWDMSFLIWGLLFFAALRRYRSSLRAAS